MRGCGGGDFWGDVGELGWEGRDGVGGGGRMGGVLSFVRILMGMLVSAMSFVMQERAYPGC